MEKVRFGNTVREDALETFLINDAEFSARRLSIQEEMKLADVPADVLASETASSEETQAALNAMMDAIAGVLRVRAVDERLSVDANWVAENFTSADLEGVVEFLRSGRVPA